MGKGLIGIEPYEEGLERIPKSLVQPHELIPKIVNDTLSMTNQMRVWPIKLTEIPILAGKPNNLARFNSTNILQVS